MHSSWTWVLLPVSGRYPFLNLYLLTGCIYYDFTTATNRASQNHAEPGPLRRLGRSQVLQPFACDGGYFAGLLGSMWVT